MKSSEPRNVWHVFLSVIGISCAGWYINTFTPTTWYVIAGFIILVFVTCASLFLFIFNNVRRAIVVSILITGILALRAAGLRDYLYLILFVASTLALNMYFSDRINSN